MPKLEGKDVGDPHFGEGIEQFNFWHTDSSAREWFSKSVGKFPRIITSQSLKETQAPTKAIALLRSISYLKQSEGLVVQNPNNVIDQLVGNGIGNVGETYIESSDNGRTNSYIIPIESGSGEVQIVVNPAWGVLWRLSQNHPLVTEVPELSFAYNPDITEAPETFPPFSGGFYISPEQLAKATDPTIVDVKRLVSDIHGLVSSFLQLPYDIKRVEWNLGQEPDEKTSSLSIVPSLYPYSFTGITFHLSKRLGLKRLAIYGYPYSTEDGRSNNKYQEIALKAREINLAMNPFHNFFEDKK